MSLMAYNLTFMTEFLSTEVTPKENTQWECCHCKEKMIYVKESFNGRITHFRHKTACEYNTEPESQEHLLGKKLLFDNFKLINKKLEQRIGNHIPDLIGETKEGLKLAIEYQCSPISVEEYYERNKNYIENGYDPIWIFSKGKNYYNVESRFSQANPFSTLSVCQESFEYNIIKTKAIERQLEEDYKVIYYLDTQTKEIIFCCTLPFKDLENNRRIRTKIKHITNVDLFHIKDSIYVADSAGCMRLV